MTIRTCAFALVLFGVIACVAGLLATAQPGFAAPPASRDACAVAQAYERTAATDSVPKQAAYDSAVAGLTVNQTCTNPQQRLVNDAYLFSMRAAAAHDLNVGDWRRDLARANVLLGQCAATRGIAGTKTADDCRTQLQYNRRYEAALAAPPQAVSPAPASPTPRPPG